MRSAGCAASARNHFKEARASIQAHHGVHGTRKKTPVKACKKTPRRTSKQGFQQEISSTLWSIAEKETSGEIHIVRQEEARVDGMEAAGINTTMLVESRRLKNAFPRVRGRRRW